MDSFYTQQKLEVSGDKVCGAADALVRPGASHARRVPSLQGCPRSRRFCETWDFTSWIIRQGIIRKSWSGGRPRPPRRIRRPAGCPEVSESRGAPGLAGFARPGLPQAG